VVSSQLAPYLQNNPIELVVLYMHTQQGSSKVKIFTPGMLVPTNQHKVKSYKKSGLHLGEGESLTPPQMQPCMKQFSPARGVMFFKTLVTTVSCGCD